MPTESHRACRDVQPFGRDRSTGTGKLDNLAGPKKKVAFRRLPASCMQHGFSMPHLTHLHCGRGPVRTASTATLHVEAVVVRRLTPSLKQQSRDSGKSDDVAAREKSGRTSTTCLTRVPLAPLPPHVIPLALVSALCAGKLASLAVLSAMGMNQVLWGLSG